MPQMSPMLWLNLYIYFFLVFMLILSYIYFMKFFEFNFKTVESQKLIIYNYSW